MLEPTSIDELRTAVRRTAAVARVTLGTWPDDPLRSTIGRVSVIGRGETWPTYEGRPMVGLAQVNLLEPTFVPTELEGIALIALWVALDEDVLLPPDDLPNGEGWELRAYPSLDALVPAHGPEVPGIRPARVAWKVVDDYPGWDDLLELVDPDLVERLLAGKEPEDAIGTPVDGAKLGGWPSLIQSELSWAPYDAHPASPVYCLQIDTSVDIGLYLWDAGVLYVGRGIEEGRTVWAATSQSM